VAHWQINRAEISDDVAQCSYVDENGRVLTFKDVIDLWASSEPSGNLFRAFHYQVLSDLPFTAYKWETPAVDLDRLDEPFEFVAVNAPQLDRRENESAFQNQFDSASEELSVIAFPNLGKNAILVVPHPSGPDVNHCHLASFLRTCSAQQASALWLQVGRSMLDRVSRKPVWLSTAGGGVAWLHVRLDDRPKYYAHQPYRSS
jgi:hypothetical protein